MTAHYPFLPLDVVERYVALAARRGVSEVARSPRGFLPQYREHGVRGLDPWWRNRRENFVKRHMAQVSMRGEELFDADGQPSRRHLALIMWAYSPVPGRLARKNPVRENPPRLTADMTKLLQRLDKAGEAGVPMVNLYLPLLDKAVKANLATIKRRDDEWHAVLSHMGGVALVGAQSAAAYPYKKQIAMLGTEPLLGGGPMVYSGKAELTFMGCVVNPVTLRPYFAFNFNDLDCGIFIPATSRPLVVMGDGWISDTKDGRFGFASAHYDLPRGHCPKGVARYGESLGTCLYAGLALTAKYFARIRHRLLTPGDGICSDDTADPPAVAWWRKAVQRGYATTETVAGRETHRMMLADAVRHGLVLDVNERIRDVLDDVADDERVANKVKTVVLNLDLSEIIDPQAVAYFYALARRWGASDDEVAAMKKRVEKSLSDKVKTVTERGDPAEVLAQMAERDGKMRVNPRARAGGSRAEGVRRNPAVEAVAARLFPEFADADEELL